MSLMFALFLGILCSQKELYAQQITGGLIVDSGLQKACAQAGGVFRPRTDAQSVTGDICEMSFSVVTSDEADATNFCELYAPWRLRSVRIEKDVAGFTRTVCVVEATFTCGAGWIQMFGHCFRRLDKFSRHNQTEAKNICANLDGHKGSIAYLHHRYIVGVWKNFFKGISQIWVDGSETWDQYIVKTGSVDGRALALAFTGDTFDFSVMPNSLISIDPNLKLEVLCQYKPDLTPAEVNYLGRRYSEIYYPGVHVSDGVLIRSASHYTRSKTNLEVCKKVLKSFYITEIEPFMPTQEVMELLTNNRPKSSHFTRSGGEYPFNLYRDLIRPKECFGGAHTYEIPYANGSSKPFELPLREIIECDNMNSVAITHLQREQLLCQCLTRRRRPCGASLGRG